MQNVGNVKMQKDVYMHAVKTEIFVYLQGYAGQERYMTQAKTHLFWFNKYIGNLKRFFLHFGFFLFSKNQ